MDFDKVAFAQKKKREDRFFFVFYQSQTVDSIDTYTMLIVCRKQQACESMNREKVRESERMKKKATNREMKMSSFTSSFPTKMQASFNFTFLHLCMVRRRREKNYPLGTWIGTISKSFSLRVTMFFASNCKLMWASIKYTKLMVFILKMTQTLLISA